VNLAAGYFDCEIEDAFAHLRDGFLAGDCRAGIHVNEIRHALGESGIVESFTKGATGFPAGVPRPVVKSTMRLACLNCDAAVKTAGMKLRMQVGGQKIAAQRGEAVESLLSDAVALEARVPAIFRDGAR
jgi:hypothetical protein